MLRDIVPVGDTCGWVGVDFDCEQDKPEAMLRKMPENALTFTH